MLLLLKWYFLCAGFVFTAGLVFGGFWFMSLPSHILDMVWAFIAAQPPAVIETMTDIKSVPVVTEGVAQAQQMLASTTDVVAPVVTSAQADVLKTVGIDPAAIPSSFTSEQIACFETVLGADRVDQIKNGAIPTFAEFTNSSKCF